MKFIKRFLGAVILNIKTAIIGLYNALPLSPPQKLKLKNLIFPYLGFLFKNSLRYKYWKILSLEDNTTNRISNLSDSITNEQPGTIAVHLHLYYIDLLGEFTGYLAQMPFRFDLYISITEKKYTELISKKIAGLDRINKVSIVTVQNRGRDVAPMVVTFAKNLSSYDYVCHIHTKKSMHAGFEQKNWRHHLLYNLLGTETIIKTIFAIFDRHSDIGIIYPETYHNIPYWTQTWLSNRTQAKKLLDMLSIDPDMLDYVDYPAGTMFWARTEVLMPLLELGLKYEDFAEEKGQIDGTIAHAVEHSLVIIGQKNGMHLCEVSFERDSYRLYLGSRNLWQYWAKNKTDLKTVISKADFVSFDILDTLVALPFLHNSDFFEAIEVYINKELGLSLDFGLVRKEAEKRVRKNKHSYSIDDIYVAIRSMTGLDSKITDSIRKMELHEAEKVAIPRLDMLDVFDYAKSIGKKIILLSDLELKKHEISSLLEKAGIHGFDDIIITSELNMRKNTGEVWDYYEQNFKNLKGIHIGHDEHADIQMLSDRNIPFYHIMSGRNIFYNTGLGHYFNKKCGAKNQVGDSLVMGTIIAREFNSPFCLSGSNGIFQISDFKTMGYVVFGPIALAFALWLVNKKKENKIDDLVFIQRENCLIRRILNLYFKATGINSSHMGHPCDEHDNAGIVLIPDNKTIEVIDNISTDDLEKHYFLFHPLIETSAISSHNSHFFIEKSCFNRFELLLLALLASGEADNGLLEIDKETARSIGDMGFSIEMLMQAYEGTQLFLKDILDRHADLLLEMPVSCQMIDFLFEILDSDMVCI